MSGAEFELERRYYLVIGEEFLNFGVDDLFGEFVQGGKQAG